VYEAVFPDRMHHLDLGLFGYMLEYTLKLLQEQCGSSAIQELNRRLANIPRFPELKICKNGIGNVKTADDFRNVVKVIVSVIDGLYECEDFQDAQFITATRLTAVFQKFVQMYLMSRLEGFSEKKLVEFEVSIGFDSGKSSAANYMFLCLPRN